MGYFGRLWQPFVQQNVQHAELCATGLLAPSLVANGERGWVSGREKERRMNRDLPRVL
jgi:hypothetical protein